MYESLSQGVTPGNIIPMPRGQTYVSNDVETLFGVPTNGAAFSGQSGSILLTDLHWVGAYNTDTEGIHVFYIRSYIGRVGGGSR